MRDDEKNIINYLKGWPNSFVSGKEIARKVGGKKRYEDDRGWAMPILTQMVRLGFIETDHLGYYRLKIEKDKKNRKNFVSPQIMKILKSSGKTFESLVIDEGLDDDDVLKVHYRTSDDAPAPPKG
jgi:hypothetical protein